jgi:hypothetical protein
MPHSTLFAILAAITWFVGGNVVCALSYRRRGMPLSSGFVPFAFPFHKFNIVEWLMMLVVALAAFGLLVLATNP